MTQGKNTNRSAPVALYKMWREKICASERITADQESSVTKQTPGKTRHDLVDQATSSHYLLFEDR